MKPNVDFPNSNTCWLTWKMTWSLDRMNQTRTGKAYKLLIIVSVMYSQSYILDLKMRQKFDKILHIFQLYLYFEKLVTSSLTNEKQWLWGTEDWTFPYRPLVLNGEHKIHLLILHPILLIKMVVLFKLLFPVKWSSTYETTQEILSKYWTGSNTRSRIH